MVPQGLKPKQIAPYCQLTQAETCNSSFDRLDEMHQKSPIQLQAIFLRSTALLGEICAPPQPQEPLSSDVATNHFLKHSLGVRCMALTPLRQGMSTLLNLIKESDKFFEDFHSRNPGVIPSEAEKHYRELSASLRQTPLTIWNLLEARLMGYNTEVEQKMLNTQCEKISRDRAAILLNKDFFQLIGSNKEITLLAKMLGALQGICKTQATAEKFLPFLAFPLDGTLDKCLGAPYPLEPSPGFRFKELLGIAPSLEYLTSCIDRNQKLLLEVTMHLRNFIKNKVNPEKSQLLVDTIADLESLQSAYDDIKANIELFLNQNKLKHFFSSCQNFLETGIQDHEGLDKVVHALESLSGSMDGFLLDPDLYSKVLRSVKNLIRDFPQFPERLCADLITDVEYPFVYLSKLTKHLVVDHFNYLKKVRQASQNLLLSTGSKSTYLKLMDLWLANIFLTPSSKKGEHLKILYQYLNLELKPLFGTAQDATVQKILKNLHPGMQDFVFITPYSRTLGQNLHHKFFLKPSGNLLDLDIEAVRFMQNSLHSLLGEQSILDTLSPKILPDLQKLQMTDSLEEFLDLGKRFVEQHPQLTTGSTHVVGILLQPLIRYLEFEALNEALRFTPSPTSFFPKKKPYSPLCCSPTPIVRRPPSISHRALQFGHSLAGEEVVEPIPLYPITQTLIQTFHTLHLDPTALYALEGLKQGSRIFKSPLLYFDETLNLFHNLLELLLDPQRSKKHDLLKMVPPCIPLDRKEAELLALLDKDRQHRLTGKQIPESVYPHHNNHSLNPHLEEEFHEHQKIFFSFVLKCLKNLHETDIELTGQSLLEACGAKTFEKKPLPSRLIDLGKALQRLRQRKLASISLESPSDTSLRLERFEQQSRKIDKSLRSLEDISHILHPDNTQMCDFSIAHQTLYHLSLLTESTLLQLLLTKSISSRTEASRHVVFDTVEGNRPLYNDHNTARILEMVLLDISLPPEPKAQIETFRNFSNIVFRYLSQAQGHCNEEYLTLLKNLLLIAKDLETLYSGFTTAEMKDLLKTDDSLQSVEKVQAIQKEAYEQILSTLGKSLDALLELLRAHEI